MSLPHTAVQFSYEVQESHASDYQIGLLLQGLGYHHVSGRDNEDGTHTVTAYNNGYLGLEGKEHEVDAICAVIGHSLDISYYHLKAAGHVCYRAAGGMEQVEPQREAQP